MIDHTVAFGGGPFARKAGAPGRYYATSTDSRDRLEQQLQAKMPRMGHMAPTLGLVGIGATALFGLLTLI